MEPYLPEAGEMDWKTCRKERLVKEIKPDNNLVASLITSSGRKQECSKMLPLSEVTAAAKISLAYDALREILEALSVSKGCKIYNHDCYCAFLKEILHEYAMSEEFDKFRKLRNRINYYGKDISANDAELLLIGINDLIEKIKSTLF